MHLVLFTNATSLDSFIENTDFAKYNTYSNIFWVISGNWRNLRNVTVKISGDVSYWLPV